MSETATPATPADRFTVAKLIEGQIDQAYDRYRMKQVWERVLANCDPAEFAEGMCMALSHGRFSRIPLDTTLRSPFQVTINVTGNADPEALASALKGAFAEAVTGHG